MTQLEQALAQAHRLCRTRGVRLTPQREAVLRLVLAADRPLSAYEILERMPATRRRPAPPTVYRALEFLLEQGLVHRIESLHAFVGCLHPEHPHNGQFLICTDCGKVDELCEAQIDQSLRKAVDASGFRTRRPVVELLGLCAKCQGARN
ncbi:MAG: transcriptional repressor [Gammaproteobacteria bacterium]|nr:MAG: transcriptional repressor [Gammaproteobacteria bacterium]